MATTAQLMGLGLSGPLAAALGDGAAIAAPTTRLLIALGMPPLLADALGDKAAVTPPSVATLMGLGLPAALAAQIAGPAGTGAAGAPGLPANLVAPAITGTAQVGQTLTATTGSWSGSPTSFNYSWRRNGGSVGVFTNTYTLSSADAGAVITVAVSAVNAAGSGAGAVSTSVSVAAPVGLPGNLVAPAITGTAQVGQTLTVTAGSWSGSPTSFNYSWRRNGSSVGVFTTTYVLSSADTGATITCAVSAVNAAGTGAAVVSAGVTVAAAGATLSAALLPATASFILGAAPGTLVWTPTNKTAGSTITFSPNDGRIAVTSAGALVVGISTASNGIIVGTVTETTGDGSASVTSPLAISVVSVRAALSNSYGSNTIANTGAAQWSFLSRKAHYAPEAYNQLRIKVPLWYFSGDTVPIASLSQSGTLVTVTLANPILLSAGQAIRVAGVAPSGYNIANTPVVSVASPTSFTYNAATSGLAPVTTPGTIVLVGVTELRLPQAYQFMAALEYPYFAGTSAIPTNTRLRFTFNGANIFTYTVGGQASAYVLSDWLALPFTVPANTAAGIYLLHECVAGANGPVTNVSITDGGAQSSTDFARFEGYLGASTSLIAADATMTTTSLTVLPAGSPAGTGGPVPMGVGGVQILTTRKTVAGLGNSIEAGAQEGYGASNTQVFGATTLGTVAYGDASGDAVGNRGYLMRLAWGLGFGVVSASKGSDGNKYRIGIANNFACRLEGIGLDNPTYLCLGQAHNDVSSIFLNGVANYAAGAAYAKGAVVFNTTSGSGYYLCTAAITTAATAPTGTGAAIVDGSGAWTFLFPRAFGSQSDIAAGWVSSEYALIAMIQAAYPAIKFIGTTMTVDTGAPTLAVSAVAYAGTTATFTVASTAGIVSGQNVRLSGNSTAAFNGTFPATVVNATTFTCTLASGLAAPGATATAQLLFTSAAGQTQSAGFGTATSARSIINGYLRGQYGANRATVLPYSGLIDLGQAVEAGHPSTMATETGVWAPLVDAASGLPVENGATQDGTHPVSSGIVAALAYLVNTAGVAAQFP